MEKQIIREQSEARLVDVIEEDGYGIDRWQVASFLSYTGSCFHSMYKTHSGHVCFFVRDVCS